MYIASQAKWKKNKRTFTTAVSSEQELAFHLLTDDNTLHSQTHAWEHHLKLV